MSATEDDAAIVVRYTLSLPELRSAYISYFLAPRTRRLLLGAALVLLVVAPALLWRDFREGDRALLLLLALLVAALAALFILLSGQAKRLHRELSPFLPATVTFTRESVLLESPTSRAGLAWTTFERAVDARRALVLIMRDQRLLIVPWAAVAPSERVRLRALVATRVTSGRV